MGPQGRHGCHTTHYRSDGGVPPRVAVPDAVGIARAVRAIDAIAEIGNRTPDEIRACILALRELSQEDFNTAMETAQIDRLTNGWDN